ncbi:MAG: hypothetical protein JWL64_2009 [Frankiales bacterium]|nr:hypothetical protein [Frankiales bacterium]
MAFVAEHAHRSGVEPICRVSIAHGIKIAPSSHYAQLKRPPSPPVVWDAQVLARIRFVHGDPELGRGLYGVRKVVAQLAREGGVNGQSVSRRKVERLMPRSAGSETSSRPAIRTGLRRRRLGCERRGAAVASASR